MKYFKITMAALFSLIFLIGSTFAIMYFTGSFNKDIIRPEQISFDVTDNLYRLDYDSEDQFVAWATILSNTTGVTLKEIRLSFATPNASTIEIDDNHISDGIIIVPRDVTIGEPFLVRPFMKLYGTDENDVNYDPEFPEGWNWIAGGISRLKAESNANPLMSAVYANFNVDIPVRKIEIESYYNENQTNSFAVGSVVTLSSKFYPAESEHALGVKKNVLYRIKAEANILDFVRTEEVFEIDGTKFYNKLEVYAQTNANPIDIEAYTFKTIIEQNIAMDEKYSESQLYNYMGNLKSSFGDLMPPEADPKDYLLTFFEPVIQSFSISSEWTEFNRVTLPFNKLVVVYANNASVENGINSNEYDLGLNIKANNGQDLPGKMQNMVLIPEISADNGKTWTYDESSFSSQPKVQVLNTQIVQLNELDFLPNESGALFGYKANNIYAWRMVGQQPADYYRFRVIYLLEDGLALRDGGGEIIAKFVHFYVQYPTSGIQVQISWTDAKPELMLIEKSNNPGETKYPDFSLRSIISINPSNAVYQSVRYFVKGVVGNPSEVVDASYYGQIEGVDIYELSPYANGIITGFKNGTVSVFAAIIKTDYAGNPILNEQGMYTFVGSTTDKTFEYTELISSLYLSVEGHLHDDLNNIRQDRSNVLVVNILLPENQVDRGVYISTFKESLQNGEISIWSVNQTPGENPLIDLLEFQSFLDDDGGQYLKLLYNVKAFPESINRDDLSFRVFVSYVANPYVQIDYGVRDFRVISGLAGGVYFAVTKNEDGTDSYFGTTLESRIMIESSFSEVSQSFTVISNGQDVKGRLFDESSEQPTIKIGFFNEEAHDSYKIYTIISSDPSVAEVRTKTENNQVKYYLEYKANNSVAKTFSLTVRLSSPKESDKYQVIYLSYKGPQAVWEPAMLSAVEIYGNPDQTIVLPQLVRLTNGLEGELKEDYTANVVTFTSSYSQETGSNAPITLDMDKQFAYDDVMEQYKGITNIIINTYIWQELKIVIICTTEFGFYYTFEIKILPAIQFSTSLPTIVSENLNDPSALPIAYASTSHKVEVNAHNITKDGVLPHKFFDNLYIEVANASDPNRILDGIFDAKGTRPTTDREIFKYNINAEKDASDQITKPTVEFFFGAIGQEMVLRVYFQFDNIPGFKQYVDIVVRPNVSNYTSVPNESGNLILTSNLNEGGIEYYSGSQIVLISKDGLEEITQDDRLAIGRLPISAAQQVVANTEFYFDINKIDFMLYVFDGLSYIPAIEETHHAFIAFDGTNNRYVLYIKQSLKSQTMFRIDLSYANGEPISFQLIAEPNLKAIKVDGDNFTNFEQTLYLGQKYHKVVVAEQGIDFSNNLHSQVGIDFLTNNFSEFVMVNDQLVLTKIEKNLLSAVIPTGSIDPSIARLNFETNNLLISNTTKQIHTFQITINKHNPNNMTEILAQISVKILLLPFDVERMVQYTDSSLISAEGVNINDVHEILNNTLIFASYEGGSGEVNLFEQNNTPPISLYLDFANPLEAPLRYMATFTILNQNIPGLTIDAEGNFSSPALADTIMVLIEVKMTAVPGEPAFTFHIRVKVTASLTHQMLYPYDVSGTANAEWRILSGNSLSIALNEKFSPDVPAYAKGISVSSGLRQRVMFFSNQSTYMSNIPLTYSIHQVWNEVNEEGLNGVLLTASAAQNVATITSNGVLTIQKQSNVNSVKVIVRVSTPFNMSVLYTVIAEVTPTSNYQLTGPNALSFNAGQGTVNLIANENQTPNEMQFSLLNNSEFIVSDVTDELGFYIIDQTQNSFAIDSFNRTNMNIAKDIPINAIQKSLILFTKYGQIREVPLTLLSDYTLQFNGSIVYPNEVQTLNVHSDDIIDLFDLVKLFDLDENELILQRDGVTYLSDYSLNFNKITYVVPTITGDQYIFEMDGDNVKILDGARFQINPLVSEQTVRVSVTFVGSAYKSIKLGAIDLYTDVIDTTPIGEETLESLKFEVAPRRTYFVGESIDFSAAKLIGIYDDGKARRIIGNIVDFIGEDNMPKTDKSGVKKVKIIIEGKELNFNIAVYPKSSNLNHLENTFNNLTTNPSGELQAIHIASLPNKTSYFIGETFQSNGLIVVGEYLDGTTTSYARIDDFEVEANLTSATNQKEVTVRYQTTFETTFNVEIVNTNEEYLEEVRVSQTDPLRLVFDLNIQPNIVPKTTESVDFLEIRTHSNQSENGIKIAFTDIFEVKDPNSYSISNDTALDTNKTYYVLENGKFIKFNGTVFAEHQTYYEVKSIGYHTKYEIISGAKVAIVDSQSLAASFSRTKEISMIEHKNDFLVLYIYSVSSEHTITIRATTELGHINIIRIVVNSDVEVYSNYPSGGNVEHIYYGDYTQESNAFDLRKPAMLFVKNRIETRILNNGEIGAEVAQNRFYIHKINEIEFPDKESETFVFGAFTLLVRKSGSFVVTNFNASLYQPQSLRFTIYIDGIQRIIYDVSLTNIPVYSFEATLLNPERIENGKELFATKTTAQAEKVFTTETIGINKKYAVKYNGINIELLNHFDGAYLSKIFVKNYPNNATTSMAQFEILPGQLTSPEGVSLQFMFEGQNPWQTTHQIKVVWDYLIRNKDLQIYAGVEYDLIDLANITERFSNEKINENSIKMENTATTQENDLWFTIYENVKHFKAKHVNGNVARSLNFEVFGKFEQINVTVMQTAQVYLVERTFEEVYFFNEENQPIDKVDIDIYETNTTSNFLEVAYTHGATNPDFAGGEAKLEYKIVVLDLQGNVVYDELDEPAKNPFGYLEGKVLHFIKPRFSRQQVVLRVSQEFFYKDFVFYVSANESDQIVFIDDVEFGFFEGDDLPTEAQQINPSATSHYPFMYQEGAWNGLIWNDIFRIEYESMHYKKDVLIKQKSSDFEYKIALLGNAFFKNGNYESDKVEEIKVTISRSYLGPNGVQIRENAIAVTSVLIRQRYRAYFEYPATMDYQVVRNGVAFTPSFKIKDIKENNRVLTNEDLGIATNPTNEYQLLMPSEKLHVAAYEANNLSSTIVMPYAMSANIDGLETNNIKFVINVNYKVAPIYSEIARKDATPSGGQVQELFSEWKNYYNFKFAAANGLNTGEGNPTGAEFYFELVKGNLSQVTVDEWGNITGLWGTNVSEMQEIKIREKLTGHPIGTIQVRRMDATYALSYQGTELKTQPMFESSFESTLLASQIKLNSVAIDGISFTQTGTYTSSLEMPKENGVSNATITVFAKKDTQIIPVGFLLTNYNDEMFTYEAITLDEIEGYRITGLKNSSWVSALEIPDAINGKPVLSIGANAFEDNLNIKSIKLGANVIEIGDSAFKGLTNVTSVALLSILKDNDGNFVRYDSKLKTIGAHAFEGNKNLLVLDVPKTVTSIGAYAFKDNHKLTSFGLSKEATTLIIGEGAFTNNRSLKTFYLPNGLTQLSSGVFAGCTSLVEFVVDNNHTKFLALDGHLLSKYGDEFIQYAAGKVDQSFTTPASVTKIADGAFKNVEKLNSVVIRNTVTEIGKNAFEGIGGTSAVTIRFEENSRIEKIGYRAFYNISVGLNIFLSTENAPELLGFPNIYNENDDLVAYNGTETRTPPKIYVPNKSSFIGKANIGWTTKMLSYVSNNPTDEKYFVTQVTENQVYISGLTYEGQQLKSITIPTTMKDNKQVTRILQTAFRGNENLEYLFIPNTINFIEAYSFENATKLKTIEFDDVVLITQFNEGLFKNASALSTIRHKGSEDNVITIPQGITSIKEYVFDGAKLMQKLSLPITMTSIHSTALLNTSALHTFVIEGTGETTFAAESDGKILTETIDEETQLRFFATANKSNFALPSHIYEISDYAFYRAENKIITLNQGLTLIGKRAFYDAKITELTLPYSVQAIESYAFALTHALTKITNLSSIALTATMFGFNSKVSTLIIDLTDATAKIVPNYGSFIAIAQVKELSILQAEKISDGAFAIPIVFTKSGITSVNISSNSGLTEIGANAFRGVEASSIALPNSIETIGSFAFAGATKLTQIALPSSLDALADYAFANNQSLHTLILRSGDFLPSASAFANTLNKYSPIGTVVFDFVGALPAASYTTLLNTLKVNVVRLGAGISSVGQNLIGANTVTRFEVDDDNQNFSSDEHLFNKNGTALVRFAIASNIADYVLPRIVTKIEASAFYGAYVKTISVEAESGLTEIGDNAFTNSMLQLLRINKVFNSFTVGQSVMNYATNSSVKVYVLFASFTNYRNAFIKDGKNNIEHVNAYLKPILNNENLTRKSSSFITQFSEQIVSNSYSTYYGFVMQNVYGTGTLTAKVKIVTENSASYSVYSYIDGVITQITRNNDLYVLSLGVQHILAISNTSMFEIQFDYSNISLKNTKYLTGGQSNLNFYQFKPTDGYFASKSLLYNTTSSAMSNIKIFDENANQVSNNILSQDKTYYLIGYPNSTATASIQISLNIEEEITSYKSISTAKTANISKLYKFTAPETATYYLYTTNIFVYSLKKIVLFDASFNIVQEQTSIGYGYGINLMFNISKNTVYYIGVDNATITDNSGSVAWTIDRYIAAYLYASDMYVSKSISTQSQSSYVAYVKFTAGHTSDHNITSTGASAAYYDSSFATANPDNFESGKTYYIKLTKTSASSNVSLLISYNFLSTSNKVELSKWNSFSGRAGTSYYYYFVASKTTHDISYKDKNFLIPYYQELFSLYRSSLSSKETWKDLVVGRAYIIRIGFNSNWHYWSDTASYKFMVS